MRLNAKLLLILLIQIVTVPWIVNVQPALASQPIPAPTMHASYNSGDPYTTVYYPSEIPTPNHTTPQIRIITPVNNTVLTSNCTVLSFDLILKALNDHQPLILREVSYRLSWQPANTTIELGDQTPTVTKTVSFSVNLTDIPRGNNTITIYAQAMSQFEVKREEVQIPVSPSGFLIGAYLNSYSNYYFTRSSLITYFVMDTSTQTPSLSGDGSRTSIAPFALIGVLVILVFLLYFLFARHTKKRNREC